MNLDKMNDCLLAGLKDKSIESYNSVGIDYIVKVIASHGIGAGQHIAIDEIINDMHKNISRNNPKSNFNGYRITIMGKEYDLSPAKGVQP